MKMRIYNSSDGALSIRICSGSKRAIKDPALNRDSITAKWFDFYSTEMDPLVEVFDQLMDRLTERMHKAQEIKENFLQSTIHERNFFNMAYIDEKWNFGGEKHE